MRKIHPADQSGNERWGASPAQVWSSRLFHVIVTMLVAAGAMATLLILADLGYNLGLLSLVFCAGTLGAVANNYKRLLQIPSQEADVPHLLDSRLVTIQLYLSPLIGGLFAIVLYAMFLSGVLAGALFPRFPSVNASYIDVSTFLDHANPEQNLDAAKALLWSFVAGFSERFVPNVLDKVIKESSERTP